jgi:hypothetical protein
VHHRNSRGKGPYTLRKIAEITTGRSFFQQGFATTCIDPGHKGKPRPREELGLAHELVVAMREG